jgi:hypothetical protein
MKKFKIKVPIAGHVEIEVEAESESEAIEKVMNDEVEISDTDATWELLRTFNDCPLPWSITVDQIRSKYD